MVWPGLVERRGLDVAASAFYVTNLRQTFQPADNPLSHTWSLAIEAQFYLLWLILCLNVTAGIGIAALGGTSQDRYRIVADLSGTRVQQTGSVNDNIWAACARVSGFSGSENVGGAPGACTQGSKSAVASDGSRTSDCGGSGRGWYRSGSTSCVTSPAPGAAR